MLTKDGKTFGTRVTHLQFRTDDSGRSVTGTCKVDTMDLNGALIMTATGTIHGTYFDAAPTDDYPEEK